MAEFKFEGNYVIKAKLKCITGLHIGGSKEKFEIGGIDNPVIKTNFSITLPDGRQIKEGMPYIPGSSLKGKIRALLEWQYDMVKAEVDNGKLKGVIIHSVKPDIPLIFGVGNSDRQISPQPTRVKFNDSYPTADTISRWQEELGENIYTEDKIENSIDRITSSANPRHQERVPAGSEFEVEVVFKVLQPQDHKRLLILFEGMKLLEDDFLGGGGSRGNGKVKFEDICVVYRNKDYYRGQKPEEKKGEFKSVEEAIQTLKQG